MDPRVHRLLNPEMLSSLKGLELVAKILSEGFMSGTNRSLSIGFGQEFSQYRNYEPGDDLRQLDWKMYARSERYFIKQSDIETNITVKFILDGSNSMTYSEGGVSKFDFGRALIAALAFVAKGQGDALGLSIINKEQLTHLRPRFAHQHFMRLLHELAYAVPGSEWRSMTDSAEVFDHHAKEMIVFVSDLYDKDDDIQTFLRHIKTRKNEVIVFHVIGQKESSLNFASAYSFRDLESNTLVKVDVKTAASLYQSRFQEWMAGTRRALLEKQIHYNLCYLQDDIPDVIRRFIHVRKNLL